MRPSSDPPEQDVRSLLEARRPLLTRPVVVEVRRERVLPAPAPARTLPEERWMAAVSQVRRQTTLHLESYHSNACPRQRQDEHEALAVQAFVLPRPAPGSGAARWFHRRLPCC